MFFPEGFALGTRMKLRHQPKTIVLQVQQAHHMLMKIVVILKSFMGESGPFHAKAKLIRFWIHLPHHRLETSVHVIWTSSQQKSSARRVTVAVASIGRYRR